MECTVTWTGAAGTRSGMGFVAETERQVLVGVGPLDVDLVGVLEDVLVTIGRHVPHDHTVALADALALLRRSEV